jgi:hypothetical protein
MSKQELAIESTSIAGIWRRVDSLWVRLINSQSAAVLGLAVFLITIAVLLMYRPFNRAEIGDQATWDYIAQSIVRGELPYRDVIANKAPAAGYFSALAIALGKLIGMRDVMAIRLFAVLLAGVLSTLTYLVTEAYLQSRAAALIAFLIPLMTGRFDEWMTGGTEPKLLMMVFGMLTLWLIAQDKPFLAGLCSMISCLAWQPGLLFTGTAFLVFSRHLTSWRDLRALKVALGAAIPLAALTGYFGLHRALGELWFWTMTFNYGVYAPATSRTMTDSLSHMVNLFLRVFEADVAIVVFSVVGYSVLFWRQVRARLRRRDGLSSPELFRDGLLIAPGVYFLFCLVNLQAGPDLIPLFPFIGIFTGLLLVESSRRVARRYTKLKDLDPWLPRVALMVVLALSVSRGAINWFTPMLTLQQQDKEFAVVSALLGPGEKLYVHGTLELLVLLNRPNLNQYVFLDRGKDEYVASFKEGGIEAWIDEIESQAPKIVALSRLKKVVHREALMRWVEGQYQSLELPGYEEIYVRKP